MSLFRRKQTARARCGRPIRPISTTWRPSSSRGQGVEAYLEPRTAVTETTIVLVAGDGEWTRRRVPGESGARDFAKKHAIPVYDAGIVGYPQRMRDWTARRKKGGPRPVVARLASFSRFRAPGSVSGARRGVLTTYRNRVRMRPVMRPLRPRPP